MDFEYFQGLGSKIVHVPCAVFAGNADLLRSFRHFDSIALFAMAKVMICSIVGLVWRIRWHGGRETASGLAHES